MHVADQRDKILSLLLYLVQPRHVDSERGVRVTHGPLGPFAGANFPCSEQDAHRGAPWARGACLITCKRPSCHRAIALCRRKPECTGVNINVEGTVATLKRETALYASPPAHNPLRPTAAHVPRPPARCSGLTSVALHARGGGTGAGLPPKISSSHKTRRTRVQAEIAPAKNGTRSGRECRESPRRACSTARSSTARVALHYASHSRTVLRWMSGSASEGTLRWPGCASPRAARLWKTCRL